MIGTPMVLDGIENICVRSASIVHKHLLNYKRKNTGSLWLRRSVLTALQSIKSN